MSGPVAVFEPDAGRYVPTDAARGPWRRDSLHGAAVSALLAGALEGDPDAEVVVRVLVELLGPVPFEPLTLTTGESSGGRRVRRQSAQLSLADGTPVASASCTRVRRADLALPDGALEHPDTFSPADAPDLGSANPAAAEMIGWECFDSHAVTSSWEPIGSPADVRVWLRLLLPIVAGEPVSGVQRAVAAADYGTAGTTARLPFLEWTYMNADLTVSLSRPPDGEWIGMSCDSIVQPTGTGVSVGEMYDHAGRLGRSAQSLLVEPRELRNPS